MANKSKFTFVTTNCNDSPDEDPFKNCDAELVTSSLNNSMQEDFQYEINSGVQYRLVGSTTVTNTLPTQTLVQDANIKTIFTQQIENNLNNSEPEMTLLNELQTNRPCVIYPKLAALSNTQTKKTLITGNRKRDEARRATHNEVERRRRDKINHWIERLRVLLPEEVTSSEKNQQTSRNTNDSKSAILIRACEYIRNMKEELENLKMCLNDCEEIENLREENNFLKAENEMLHIQNDSFKVLTTDDKNNITKILQNEMLHVENDSRKVLTTDDKNNIIKIDSITST